MQEAVEESHLKQIVSKVKEVDLNQNIPLPAAGEDVAAAVEAVIGQSKPTSETEAADSTTPPCAPESAKVTVGSSELVGMGLHAAVVETLQQLGLDDVTTDQGDRIRHYTQSDEKLCLLESGTGRSISFLSKAAVLQQVDPGLEEHQILIVVPARIAGLHVTRIVRALASGHDVRVRGCIGGYPLINDISSLRTGVQVVVGTGGRLIDLLDRCVLNTSYFKTIVLENADELLAHHRYEVWQLWKRMPSDVRVVLLSSTLSPELIDAMKEVMAAKKEDMEKLKPDDNFEKRDRSNSKSKAKGRKRSGSRQTAKEKQEVTESAEGGEKAKQVAEEPSAAAVETKPIPDQETQLEEQITAKVCTSSDAPVSV